MVEGLSSQAPRVSSIGLEPDVSFCAFFLITGLTLLIPLGRGPIIRVNGLPHLPSMEHREVLEEFSTSLFPQKKEKRKKGLSSPRKHLFVSKSSRNNIFEIESTLQLLNVEDFHSNFTFEKRAQVDKGAYHM